MKIEIKIPYTPRREGSEGLSVSNVEGPGMLFRLEGLGKAGLCLHHLPAVG